jgi:hypothetical protein
LGQYESILVVLISHLFGLPENAALFQSENAKMLFHTQALGAPENLNRLGLVWILAFSGWHFNVSQFHPAVQHELGMVTAKELNQKFMVFSGEVSAEKAAVHTIFHEPTPFNATISRSILRNSILFHCLFDGANTAFQAPAFGHT